MIEIKQLKYIPQWGDVLIERVRKAGYENIKRKDLPDIKKLQQIGIKRMNNLYKYIKWYEKNKQHLVERNKDYEIYVENGKVTILFSMEVKNTSVFKTESHVVAGRNVKGTVHVMYKGKVFLYDWKLEGSCISVKRQGGSYVTVPKWFRQTIRRAGEITRVRHGVKTA